MIDFWNRLFQIPVELQQVAYCAITNSMKCNYFKISIRCQCLSSFDIKCSAYVGW